MSGELDSIEKTLKEISVNAKSPDAIGIIDTLTKEIERLRVELLYANLDTPPELPDSEVTAFKRKVYEKLKGQRATDLVIVYNRSYFEDQGLKPVTILAVVQALVTIANEQKTALPPLWQRLLDSRGHL